MERHKKYTNWLEGKPPAANDVAPLPGSSQAYFEELDPSSLLDDPDLASQLKMSDDFVPAIEPSSETSMLFQQLTQVDNPSTNGTDTNIANTASQSNGSISLMTGRSEELDVESKSKSPQRQSPIPSAHDNEAEEGTSNSCISSSAADASPVDVSEPQPGTSSGLTKDLPFRVQTNLISSVPMTKQASELQDLGLTVYNQDELEQGIMHQVDQAMAAQEQERLKKILEKDQKTVSEELRGAKEELKKMEKVYEMFLPQKSNKEVNRRLTAISQQKDNKTKQIKKLSAKLKSINHKLSGNTEDMDTDSNQLSTTVLDNSLGVPVEETEYDRMIRLGEMTPFGTVMGFEDPVLSAHRPKKPKEPPKPKTLKAGVSDFDDFLRGQQKKAADKQKKPLIKRRATDPVASVSGLAAKKEKSDVNGGRTVKYLQNGSMKSTDIKKKHLAKSASDTSKSKNKRPAKKKSKSVSLSISRDGNMFDQRDKRTYRSHETDFSQIKSRPMRTERLEHNFAEDSGPSDFEVGDEDLDEDVYRRQEDSDYLPEDEEEQEDEEPEVHVNVKKGFSVHHPPMYSDSEDDSPKGKQKGRAKTSSRYRDDGNMGAYQKRMKLHMKEKLKKQNTETEDGSESGSDMEFDRGLIVPGTIWKKLYRYQKTGVRWLWELHCQQSGGIVGDEMGLGKTIQIIAFLTGLKESGLRDKASATTYQGLGPTLIVTPATVMHQWVKEFHKWWPSFRVAILHSSGSYNSSVREFVHSMVRSQGVVIAAYSSVLIHQDLLLKYNWHYVILDEGHKIRNPDAKITLACKMFRTCHRLILSGSPMQNNLKELWSLFDFVFPGKLGTLPDFMAHFSVPIVQGGYSNATDIQVQTAYKCACVLRDTINPYLLRRMKADVKNNVQLPDKNEQVLFCRLTEHQRDVYKEYLESRECREILDRNFLVFPGLITLRKICNHPDISTGGPKVFDPELLASEDPALEYGFWKRSGKMIVVESLLKLWKKQSHRVLLFSQSTAMLNILESFVISQGYTYMRMDGGTPIGSRHSLIQKFNEDASVFVFLLTTRVGGLGVNLTGANRVVIFDPDWNPSTDTQARERSWRIGQTKQVTIYRLLTTGTIEEKIYHRQIFKQFLTNRVLKDPKQRRFFKSNDLFDLFTLGDDDPTTGTETSAIFAGTETEIAAKKPSNSKTKNANKGPAKVNRFDLIKEKQKEVKQEMAWSSEEEIEHSAPKQETQETQVKEEEETSAEDRLAKMKELVRRLSQKISSSLKDETPDNGTPAPVIPDSQTVPTSSAQSQCEATKETRKKESKRKKSKHKKKRKERQDAEIEGEKISYLDSHSTYQKQDDESDQYKTGDAYVLEKLFKKKGVHSALQHDKIMMSSDPDYALVEAEASRVAKQAAKALKQSRARCLRAESGMPTWTGQSGGLKQPGARPRFGNKKRPQILPTSTSTNDTAHQEKTVLADKEKQTDDMFDGSVAGNVKTSGVPDRSGISTGVMTSTELKSRMMARNNFSEEPTQIDDVAGDSLGDGISSVRREQVASETMELMTDLRNHIAFGCETDGQATTQELLSQFKGKLPTGDSAKFKALLKSICDFHRSHGVGVWRLKPEYR